MRAIISDGPIPTAIWLCAGDNKPANASSPVYKGGLTVRELLPWTPLSEPSSISDWFMELYVL